MTLEKYRARNPVPETLNTDASIIAVIPAYREAETLAATIESLDLGAHEDTHLIVVVNQEADADDDVTRDNHATAQVASSFDGVTVVDRYTTDGAFSPGNGGVGAARRVGMDLATHAARSASVRIVSLDADAVAAPGFLAAVRRWRGETGLARFAHALPAEPKLRAAIIEYETWLRAFALGLRYAGSPYAHVSLGSRIIASVGAYAAVAGMPRRQAGEDFYFLQKLVKAYGPLETIPGALVQPSGRPSDRVAFGTGPAVRAIAAGSEIYRHAEPHAAFRALRDVVESVEALRRSDAPLEALHPTATELLAELDAPRVLARFREQHRDSASFGRAFHAWFDALRTNQLVRRIADAEGRRPIEELVETLTGIPRGLPAEDRLAALR